MDAFDRRILQRLQLNSRLGADQLGAELGLSASACQRRIRRLREQGIIRAEVALLNSDKLPGHCTVIVDINLEKGGEQVLDELVLSLQCHAQVQQIYYTAGDTDLVVIVVAKSMAEYDELSRRLFMANVNIRKFTSRVVIRTHKADLAVPLE